MTDYVKITSVIPYGRIRPTEVPLPYPLTLATILRRNRLLFGKKEVVSRDFSGIHRDTYAEDNVRVAKLANAIMSHPAVAAAAVIGVPSEKWTERPMACVGMKPDFAGKVGGKEILDFLATRVAKWWIPDEVIFVDAVPKTSVGKFAKRFLRDRFKEKRFA
jgi:non-ribosomal peptide synthetase component E (peptide arylation enzyme)